MNVFNHHDIIKALAAGLAEAEKHNVKVGISIVDEAANLVGSVQMPDTGYPWLSEDAKGKAMATVVWLGVPSGQLEERAGRPMMTWLNTHYKGQLNYLRGAVPIKRGGKLVGAAGAGGAPTEIDERIATAVAKVLGDA